MVKITLKEKNLTKFIFKQISNTVFGVFLKIETRSHGLDKQNAVDSHADRSRVKQKK